MVCTKKPLLVLIVESRGFFGSANNASCLDNAFVSLRLRIPPRVLHFSALVVLCVCVCVRGPHLRLAQLSDKLDILAVSVSCWLVFKKGFFRIMASFRR